MSVLCLSFINFLDSARMVRALRPSMSSFIKPVYSASSLSQLQTRWSFRIRRLAFSPDLRSSFETQIPAAWRPVAETCPSKSIAIWVTFGYLSLKYIPSSNVSKASSIVNDERKSPLDLVTMHFAALSTSIIGRLNTLETLLTEPLPCIFRKLDTSTTFHSPYISWRCFSINGRLRSSKSMSISGKSIRPGLMNREKMSLYLIGSMLVILRQ